MSRHTAMLLCCFLAFVLSSIDRATAIEAKCSACQAVARELQRRISNEKPRNHLDLRHRLDSEGKRYGKVLPYQGSELRAVELLDGLCSNMKDYTLLKPSEDSDGSSSGSSSNKRRWAKFRGAGFEAVNASARPETLEEEAKGKALEAYCGFVVEEHEEAVYEGIMKGGYDAEGVEGLLCSSTLKACKAPSLTIADPGTPGDGNNAEQPQQSEAAQPAAAGAAGSDGEL